MVVLASSGVDGCAGLLDASPRGGAPGFVKVPDAHTLLTPDAQGYNRLDTLENIVATGHIWLLFLLPGMDETLRVTGTAVLTTAAPDIALCTDNKRTPKLVIRVTVQAAHLHCAKALMRSRLWSADAQVSRTAMSSMGEMMKDQIDGDIPAETLAEMLACYAKDL